MVLKKIHIYYILLFILLFFSGNPLASKLFGNKVGLVMFGMTILVLGKKIILDKLFFHLFLKIAFFLIVLFSLQNLVLGFVSWLGAFNFMLKILTGGIIVYYLKSSFPYVFFKVVFFLSLISLFFYFIINVLGISMPNILLSQGRYSYLFYSASVSHFHQNQGMFWEPGAFAGVLTLCLALNFERVTTHLKRNRREAIVITMALFSTMSTTGFLVFFVIVFFAILKFKYKFLSLILMPFLFFIASTVYQNTEFLKDKVEGQFQKTRNQEIGDFSNTRFGALIFDWDYIKKHPLIGNGLHEKTRYADHSYLLLSRDNDLGMGNGFSHYLASLGVFFIIGYFYLTFKALRSEKKIVRLLIIVVIILNLQGEQWFNFPLYLSLPFLYNFKLPYNQRFGEFKSKIYI